MTASPGRAYAEMNSMSSTKDVEPSVQKRRCCNNLVIAIALMISGVILLVVGIVFGTYVPTVINDQIMAKTKTCSLADVKESYRDPHGDCDTCVPLFYSLYPFNVTNPDAVLHAKQRPFIQENGPYVFRKFAKKENVSFSEDQATVSYRGYTQWVFDKEKSCKTCTLEDSIIQPDMGYLAVMTQAGGEVSFVNQLLAGMGASKNIIMLLPKSAKQGLLSILYGLNSLNPTAMIRSAQNFNELASLMTNPMVNAARVIGLLNSQSRKEAVGLPQFGAFTARTISQSMYGPPSFLAGLPLGAAYGKCQVDKIVEKCQDTQFRVQNLAECGLCMRAAGVVKVTPILCEKMRKLIFEATKNEETADTFIERTCGRCTEKDGYKFCLAPLPGSVEYSGKDYSKVQPDVSTLPVTIQKTGCNGNMDEMGEYVIFEGTTEQPVWKKSDKTINPTISDLKSFAASAHCSNEDVQCKGVIGSDGASMKPGGADLYGLLKTPTTKMKNLYVSQAKSNVTIFDSGETVNVEGVDLRRYRPSNDLLSKTPFNQNQGIGIPVNGVLNLGYIAGFRAFLSLPHFIFGDLSLLSNIDLFSADGTRSTKMNLYEANGQLRESIMEKYSTYTDVEVATGKTFNARKRLMASYAFAKLDDSNSSVTDMMWPDNKPEILFPVYWGEESATITPSLASKFKKVEGMGRVLLPLFIVGIVLGSILILLGIFFLVKYHQQRRKNIFSNI